jgi:hypothetical protein
MASNCESANGPSIEFPACPAHELRNEVVEELIPDLMSESRAELDVELVGESRNRGMESEKGRR